jgi:hypothetical protein
MQKLIYYVVVMLLFSNTISSCKKGPGEGGTSSITGYVHVTRYNSTFVVVDTMFDGADEDVYIIYGDDISFGDRTKTNPEGRFEFKYLREGSYKVYVYSEGNRDTFPSGNYAVYKDVEITDKKQTVDVGIIEIKKN